jgi:hypothetical protein
MYSLLCIVVIIADDRVGGCVFISRNGDSDIACRGAKGGGMECAHARVCIQNIQTLQTVNGS